MARIKQAVGKVVLTDGKHFWIRISRAYFSNTISYWRNYANFRYMKIYEIKNYRKGEDHAIGYQIGYITMKGSKLDISGIQKTVEQLDFKHRNKL